MAWSRARGQNLALYENRSLFLVRNNYQNEHDYYDAQFEKKVNYLENRL